MRAASLLLFACMAIVTSEALAIDWTKTWTNPPDIRLPVCERTGKIEDTQTRAQIASRDGLAGNVQRIAEIIAQMRAAGWQSQGQGDDQRLSIAIPYRMVCTAALDFAVLHVDDEGMTTGVRRVAGDCDLRVDKRAASYLTPDKVARLKQIGAEFIESRKVELERLRKWNNLRHAWRTDELGETRRRTDGVFVRTMHYDFCGPRNRYQTTFHAAWRGALGARKSR